MSITKKDAKLNSRHNANIKNNRGFGKKYRTSVYQKNKDITFFVGACGVRRQSLTTINPSQAIRNSENVVIGFSVIEKGGKQRNCYVLDGCQKQITSFVDSHYSSQGNKRIWKKITCYDILLINISQFEENYIMIKIKECNVDDIEILGYMNKQLIEDEKSKNPMTIAELNERMKNFLEEEYNGYFFMNNEIVVGYALIKHTVTPLYLRQFFIKREFRNQHYGIQAFEELKRYLNVDCMDIEVLSTNDIGKAFWKKCGFKEYSQYMQYNPF